MQASQQRILARRQLVEGRVLDDKIALPHRAADVHDRMTRGAPQTGLRLRCVDLPADRLIEPSVEEHCVIVAPRAPLGRLRARDILQVLDRLAIPLVVERRKVVGRRIPLLVNVGVASATALAGQEKI